MTRATLLAVLVLFAGCGRWHHREFDAARANKHVTDHIDDVLDDVEATDAQRARILAVKDRLLPEVASLVAAQQKVRQEVVAQLSSDHPDQARLHALVDQQVEAARTLAHHAVDGVLEAHATLTPEQRAPLVKKMRRFSSP